MKVNIANHEYTIQWDGVYYFALSDYPNISDWELRKLVYFMQYEKLNGRNIQIICDDDSIMSAVNNALAHPETVLQAQKPAKITECTACKQKGCLTESVCHTASIESAKLILACGKILSAVNARNMSGADLVKENRNATGDPADYFEYLMMSWGNCQSGDRLVMERMLSREPNKEDLSTGLMPGVRFYFKYDTIITHPNYVFDGYHPAKIKDELVLTDYLFACIIPEQYKSKFEKLIPANIASKVYYIKNDCKDIWDWSEKVYKFIENNHAK